LQDLHVWTDKACLSGRDRFKPPDLIHNPRNRAHPKKRGTGQD
jgi:hypothetical protein